MSIRKKNNDIFFGFSKVDLVADQHFVLTAAIMQRRERESEREKMIQMEIVIILFVCFCLCLLFTNVCQPNYGSFFFVRGWFCLYIISDCFYFKNKFTINNKKKMFEIDLGVRVCHVNHIYWHSWKWKKSVENRKLR